MPRTKEQFEKMRKATRDKIQLAAMRLFVQKGFGSTSVHEISDLAGISIGLLYRQYKTKEELFNDLVEYSLTRVKNIIDFFEKDDSPRELVNQFVYKVYNDIINGEELANLLILMAQSFLSGAANPKQNEIIELDTKMLQATAKCIERGQELGEFRPGNANELATLFYSAIQGMAMIKISLKESFIMPSPSVITSILFNWLLYQIFT